MTRLISKTYRHFKGKVYDLTVEGTHSYNIEGVPVHNCGGSLVAYLMGITDVDPIRFNLFFERFINPSRIDLPDADLDFMSSRRHEVIAHIVERYGQENVAGISNYSTLGAASALRDVSRMHGLSPIDYACSKQMEKEHGVSLSLTESAERVPDIAKFKEKYPAIWDHSVRLEGAMRQLGQHAAGVVIAGEPVVKRAAVETRTGGPVTNWDKTMVEDFGLIKIDVLGLTTLDILKKAVEYIQERHGATINLLGIPLDDPLVMGAFSRAETVGVFQFEGCLSGDAIVGGVSMRERYENQILGETESLDEESMSIVKEKIAKVLFSGKKTTYTLELEDGSKLRLTATHPVYVKDKGWTQVQHLTSEDSILSLSEETKKV